MDKRPNFSSNQEVNVVADTAAQTYRHLRGLREMRVCIFDALKKHQIDPSPSNQSKVAWELNRRSHMAQTRKKLPQALLESLDRISTPATKDNSQQTLQLGEHPLIIGPRHTRYVHGE